MKTLKDKKYCILDNGNICLKDENNLCHNILEVEIVEEFIPGLYDTNNKLVYSWDELTSMELKIPPLITIDDGGKVTKNVFYLEKIDYRVKYLVGKLILDNSVTSIGSCAFANCTGLTSITIPDSVTNIEYSAFSGCTSLTNIILPSNLTNIGTHTFSWCTSLTNITIPSSVEFIDEFAFCSCISLTSIIISEGVEFIETGAFHECTNLVSIIVDKNNSDYDSRNNCNAIIDTKKNELLLGCKNTIIPSSVTSIGCGAFANCTGLTSITIPESVTSIGHSAFSSCTNLESITLPKSLISVGKWTMDLTDEDILESEINIKDSVFFECQSLKEINYIGTEEEWNKIGVSESVFKDYDGKPLNIKINYNYKVNN